MLNGHTVQSVDSLVFIEGFESVRGYLCLRYNRVHGLSSNMKYKEFVHNRKDLPVFEYKKRLKRRPVSTVDTNALSILRRETTKTLIQSTSDWFILCYLVITLKYT